MIAYKLKNMNDFPSNCKDCPCHWCRIACKNSKYEAEVKKAYQKKRHEECPLIEIKSE